MFSKLFMSVLIVTSAFTLIFGQTPEASKEKAVQAFAWSLGGDGGYLGIQTQEVTKENFAKFGLREVRGVAVEKVLDDSPAQTAGLQSGDVIVRFNGEEIASARKLTRLIAEIDPDHQAKITVVRGGSEQDVTVTLGKRPMPMFENGNFAFTMPGPIERLDLEKFRNTPELKDMPNFKDMPDLKNLPEMPRAFAFPGGEGKNFVWGAGTGRQIGVSVYAVTKQLGERFGVESGVMINNVREDSPAAKAGLKAGDIIVEVEGKAVKNNLDLIRSVNGKKEGDVQVTIVRDRNRQTISVTPETSKDGGFFFQSDGEDGLTTMPAPNRMRLTPMPVTPMPAPAPMTPVRPGRVI